MPRKLGSELELQNRIDLRMARWRSAAPHSRDLCRGSPQAGRRYRADTHVRSLNKTCSQRCFSFSVERASARSLAAGVHLECSRTSCNCGKHPAFGLSPRTEKVTTGRNGIGRSDKRICKNFRPGKVHQRITSGSKWAGAVKDESLRDSGSLFPRISRFKDPPKQVSLGFEGNRIPARAARSPMSLRA